MAAGPAVEVVLIQRRLARGQGCESRGVHCGRSSGKVRSRSDKAKGIGKACFRNIGTGGGDCRASWLILVR